MSTAAFFAMPALLVYAAAPMVLGATVPRRDELPADFPATLPWRFRIAATASQGMFWLVAGDLFGGALALRAGGRA